MLWCPPAIDPPSVADHEALDALVDAPSPAAWLERDYLGAILADLEA